MPVVRSQVPRTGIWNDFTTLTSRALGAVQSTLCVGGSVIFASATCSLLFAKASAATLLQQEMNDSADVQRGRLNIFNFICKEVS
jgi:hypothetical protein